MADTLLLDRTPWDLCLDVRGDIALASYPYSIVQDVASACRLFVNELYYGGSAGIPYFQQVLGRFRPTQVLKNALVNAALTVPGVISAQAFLTDVSNTRAISGQVQVRLTDGSTQIVTL